MAEKIIIIIADNNFRDEEYKEPRQVLENAGYEITVANKSGKEATGMLGMKVNPDAKLTEVNESDYKAIIFVGGKGASEYFADSKALNLAKSFYEAGKLTTAICIAPSILANAGILKGKKATCFSSEKNNLKEKGADYTETGVVSDGKVITANGPKSAKQFGNEIVKALK